MDKLLPQKIPEIINKIEENSIEIDISSEKLAGMIDNTELSSYKTEKSIKSFCKKTKKYNFHSVCVNPYYTKFCSNQLQKNDIIVDTVIGFPLGQTTTQEKVFETLTAFEDGAEEIDMVMNVAALKDGKYDFVKEEINEIVDTAGSNPVKVIIEAPYLTYKEIIKACKIAEESGASFVKNSTGFAPYGANIVHTYIMKRSVGKNTKIKAAGRIKNFRSALRIISAGADRIGTSSGLEIIESYESLKERNWSPEKIPCNLCPSQKISSKKIPEPISDYYKSLCSKCRYEK